MEVVSEIKRYAQRRIIVASSIRQTRFKGTVSPARVGDWLKALEQIYAEGVEHGGGAIHIESRDVHGARS